MNKKILIVTTEFPPLPGGIGNHAFCLARELSKLGYSITVLTEIREQTKGDWQRLVEANPDLTILGIKRRKLLLVTYLTRIVTFFFLLISRSYRAVIFSGKFSVWLNGMAPQTGSIVVLHGTEIQQGGLSKILFDRGVRRAKRIICVSNYTKSQLISKYKGLDESRINVINNGFNSENFEEDHTDRSLHGSLKLITVGGIHKRKGQFNVVNVLPAILRNFPNTNYSVVGIPMEKPELVKLAERNEVINFVNFYHGLRDEEVRSRLRESHIFMMLSEHLPNGDFEGFGIAIMEAMALGIPAIGTKDSGISDAICNNFSGILVDPHDVEEIIEAIKTIVNEYELYSRNAREWANGFRWEVKILDYREVIDKL